MKTKAHKKRSGITIIEIMIAQLVFLLAVAGALTAYIMAHRTYSFAGAHTRASRQVGHALASMVYGAVSGVGIREASADTVVVSHAGGGWMINFNTNFAFLYSPVTQDIRDQNGGVVCENVVTSSLSEVLGKGVSVEVSVSDSAAGADFVSTMETFIEYRNE